MYKTFRRPSVFHGEDPDFSFEQAHAELASDLREYDTGDNELDERERASLTILAAQTPPARPAQLEPERAPAGRPVSAAPSPVSEAPKVLPRPEHAPAPHHENLTADSSINKDAPVPTGKAPKQINFKAARKRAAAPSTAKRDHKTGAAGKAARKTGAASPAKKSTVSK